MNVNSLDYSFFHPWTGGPVGEVVHSPYWLLWDGTELDLHALSTRPGLFLALLVPQRNPLPRMAHTHDFTIQMGADNKFL